MSRKDDERIESEYECRGCGIQFNGWGTLSYHSERCVKALLLELEDGMPDMRDPGEPNDYPED